MSASRFVNLPTQSNAEYNGTQSSGFKDRFDLIKLHFA